MVKYTLIVFIVLLCGWYFSLFYDEKDSNNDTSGLMPWHTNNLFNRKTEKIIEVVILALIFGLPLAFGVLHLLKKCLKIDV